MGQHALSASAYDAALVMAKARQLLLSEALCVRGRATVGAEAGGLGPHWDPATGKARLEEAAGRMAGPRGELEELLQLA